MQIQHGPYRRDAVVLLAESDQDHLDWARSVLAQLGCQITLAIDGVQAFHIAKARRHDAVLVDCHLPRLDGYTFAERIRDHERAIGRVHCPIVGMLHRSDTVRLSRFRQAGMDAYLPKPIEFMRAQEVLEACFHGSVEEGLGTAEPAAPVADDPDVILGQFAVLAGSAGEDMVHALVKLFPIESGAEIDSLQLALTTGDRDLLVRSARLLKGSAANLGLRYLSDLCRNLELSAREVEPDQCGEQVARIAAVYRRSLDLLLEVQERFGQHQAALEPK